MINIPNAEDASDISHSYRTKNLQDTIKRAMHEGKQCCYLSSHLTNPEDVLELQDLGYETSVDSRSDLWIYWRRLNG
tara:strand:- start:781 stop:1011 length:231 start_codon:yes stop_codon:yes gene_type:complete